MDDATWKLDGSSAEVLAAPSAGGPHSAQTMNWSGGTSGQQADVTLPTS